MKQLKPAKSIPLRAWVIGLSVIMITAIIAAILLLFSLQQCGTAEIWQQGRLLYALPLSQDTQIKINTPDGNGYNIITIQDGQVCVSQSDCATQSCVSQGFRKNSLMPIVCLPHGLTIKCTNTPVLQDEPDIIAH